MQNMISHTMRKYKVEKIIVLFTKISRCYLLVQEISTSSSAEIMGNNLAGSIRLKDFTTYLKWSEIGDLQIHLLQVSAFLDCVRLQQVLVLENLMELKCDKKFVNKFLKYLKDDFI